MTQEFDKSHGSPHDRGKADKFYGRPDSPHKYVRDPNYPNDEMMANRITLTDPEEILQYYQGYDNETDQKDYR